MMKLLIVLTFVAAFAQVQASSEENSDKATYRPKRGQHPYVTHIRTARGNDGSLRSCAGSLIHPRWCLTAARCVNDIATGSHATFIWKRLGVIDVRRPSLVVETTLRVLNPSFDGIHHDLALINLNRYVHSSEFIQPVRLQTQTVNFPLGESFQFCSWGLTEDRTRPAVDLRCSELESAGLLSSCPVPPFPFQNLICALGPAACDSDLGSPLVIAEDGVFTQVGVLAYGPGNCANPIPNNRGFTFTRISLYTDWISNVTGLDLSPPAGNETESIKGFRL